MRYFELFENLDKVFTLDKPFNMDRIYCEPPDKIKTLSQKVLWRIIYPKINPELLQMKAELVSYLDHQQIDYNKIQTLNMEYYVGMKTEIRNAILKWLNKNMNKLMLTQIPSNDFSMEYWGLQLKTLYKFTNFDYPTEDTLKFFYVYFNEYKNFKSGNAYTEEETVDKIANFIIANCDKFLNDINDTWPTKLLWRGSRQHTEYYIERKMRVNRSSSADNFKAYKYINQYMKENGFNAIRSNSILTTGSIEQAICFGHIAAIFPIGDYVFTWSPSVKDYLYKLEDTDETNVGKKSALLFRDQYMWTYKSEKDSTIEQAIASDNEIMLRSESGYIAVNRDIIKRVIEKITLKGFPKPI